MSVAVTGIADALADGAPARSASHIAYVVQDLREAVRYWADTLGAGPFFFAEKVPFDVCVHRGEAAAWDHATAFGQAGPIAVELIQQFRVEPPGLAETFVSPGWGHIHHISYFSDDPERESARLTELGYPLVLTAKTGVVEIRLHDVAFLGHHIEIHRNIEFMVDFFEMVRNEAARWDGTEPFRPIPGLVDGKPQ